MLQHVYKNYTFLPPDGSLLHKNVTEYRIKDPMQYEGTRFSSFATFPEINGVYATRLAGAGFYYTGNGDEVICFNCHISYKNWKQHDSPDEIHRRLSPKCDFIRNTRSNLKEYAIAENNVRSGACGSPSFNNTINNIPSFDLTRTEAYQIPNNYSSNDANSLIRIPQPNLSSINYNTRESNSQFLNTITSTDRTIASKAPSKPMTMEVCIDNPKYPKYAIRISRLDSFKHWPTYLTQSPDEMVSAGFFFTGNEDHCRCFFCGGGLRNWEPGDKPWIEHARWYQNCAFVRNCKGDRFIEDVQTNNYMQTEIVEKNELPVEEFKDIPAIRSVSQFGYDEKLVKEAYDNLKTAGTSDITNLKQSQGSSNHNKHQTESSRSAIEPLIKKEVNNKTTCDPELELSVRSLEEENQNLRDEQTCKICLDEPIAIVFLPCGHLAACVTCAPALRRCPICRTFIKGTVKAIMC
ncbi:unnamed protein product [Mytilus coruscus]|uniref:RING-type domain-containing protein n=1 Tax=Mytilus coruscus TaxID=42192 RepID=A0A6J8CG14_MYTCO|nr:unnamed protein product [Mytilus coruscus]